jgi:hypothetical protein
MMTKKRLALFAVLSLTVAVMTLCVLTMLPPGPCVTKANCERIEHGMTLAQVEEVFGRLAEVEGDFGGEGPAIFIWWNDDGSVARISFLKGGVDSKIWFDSNETIPDKIRRWLHLK